MKGSRPAAVEIILRETQYTGTTLTCSSDCTPTCDVSWYKDWALLSSERRKYIYIVPNRRKAGNYSCTASGVEGVAASEKVKITVHCE
jgi:hypothetical protein